MSDAPNITQELYKRNAELAIRNKTLSLLSELYQVSILILEPKDLAQKITDLIQKILELEFVAIYTHNREKKELNSLSFSASDNFEKAFFNATGDTPSISTITEIQETDFAKLVQERRPIVSEWLPLWSNLDDKTRLKIRKNSAVRSALAYPLIIESQVVGLVAFGLNHTYEELSQFEKESINSIVNVIAVSVDRATLDEQLKLANVRLKDLDRQKTEFLSIASHQLRTPLTAIKGYSSMLIEGSFGELSEKTKGAVDVIYQSSQRLVSVIEDFLNITRIELGKMKYDVTVFDIRDLVKNVTDELIPFAKRKKLDLNISLGRGAYQVSADYGKLSQVVSNVIDNAIKYTPSGSVSVEVLRPIEDPKHIHIRVKDTGIGIAAESIPKLFQKFIRADEVGKTHIQGTGLGLYVVKQILDAHKATISIESPGVGKGSTFSIILNDYQTTEEEKAKNSITEFADNL